MKKLLLTVVIFSGLIIIRSIAPSALETTDQYSADAPETIMPAKKSGILSVEVAKSNLHLIVLGTLTSGETPRVMIKNPVTGELGTFAEGDTLDLIRSEAVKIVEIAKCVILIERTGNLETMECNNKMPTVVFSGPAALAKYKIVRPGMEGSHLLSSNFISAYDKDILTVSEKHGVDPYLVKAVIKAESDFDPNAVSPKNAQGIMQLIPGTANDYGVINPFDPHDNMDGGVRYLKDLLEYFDGDLNLSLAAYNAGKGAVIKHGFTIPPYPETSNYITKVLGYYKLLKAKNYALKK
ncbi:MAG: lytic transglycosylase domain-containing protein [Deltaproteobacteria bacterium]